VKKANEKVPYYKDKVRNIGQFKLTSEEKKVISQKTIALLGVFMVFL